MLESASLYDIDRLRRHVKQKILGLRPENDEDFCEDDIDEIPTETVSKGIEEVAYKVGSAQARQLFIYAKRPNTKVVFVDR